MTAGVQARVDSLAAAGKTEHNLTCTKLVTCTGSRAVRYVGLLGSGTLSIPTARCECGKDLAPEPVPAGCFPSTPTSPSIWFDAAVLRSYRYLGLHEGLSAAGECLTAEAPLQSALCC